MKIAGRFRLCVHMGCFDLETFVEMQQRSRKASKQLSNVSLFWLFEKVFKCRLLFSSFLQWQCPICLKNYSLESLIIDPYFNRIANMVVTIIELSKLIHFICGIIYMNNLWSPTDAVLW